MLTIDPNKVYTHIEPQRLVDACGYIPQWMDMEDERSFKQQIIDKYGFPVSEMTGGTVDDKGNYQYPEDPLLHPILKWEREGEVAYMYEYAIMAFVKDGVTFVTRVD